MTNKLLAGTIGLALGLLAAPPALASTVTVTGGNTIRVAEMGNEANRIGVGYDAAANVYSVSDASANLTPSGTCTVVNAHTASCPGAGIKAISVDTGDRDDSIVLDTATIPPSITGTLDGDRGNDVVSGHGTLNGGSGNDTVVGSPLADRIRGGSGKDQLNGDDGADDMGGGRSTDMLAYPVSRQTGVNVTMGSGNGNDGGPEDQTDGRRDTVRGDIEVLFGTVTGDVLVGDGSSETLVALGGDDLLFGNGGRDTLLAFEGNDLTIGGGGNDVAQGGFGSDRLFGKSGRDRLAGGPDSDFLRGGKGADVMKGRTGIDRINAHAHDRDVKINCGPGSNKLEGARRDKPLDPRPRSC